MTPSKKIFSLFTQTSPWLFCSPELNLIKAPIPVKMYKEAFSFERT